ncbi:MAG: hypothetical protein E7420_00925 [Ruminococcaceae bacterium]|nr:hypothetical protein [Oscillospiraceae bacterium]
MLSFLRSWILGLAGAAIFCGLITELCPSGAAKKVLKLLCGAVMSIALVSPLIKLDMPSYSLNLAKYRNHAENISLSAKNEADSYSRSFIEEQCRAYILDKAVSLGIHVNDAAVKMKWNSAGFWYPYECIINGDYNAVLADYIECELGLGADKQKWRTDENT